MEIAAPAGTDDFDTRTIEEFRANGGRVGGPLAGIPMILIHHIGAKSGIERVTPLAHTPLGDGRYAIVASNGGSPTHPSWYYNLKANARFEVEMGTETFTVEAEELDGSARSRSGRSCSQRHLPSANSKPGPDDRSQCSCWSGRIDPDRRPRCTVR